MKTLQFSITVTLQFVLKIFRFKPGKEIGLGWRFSTKEVYGDTSVDGITSFGEVLRVASALPAEDGYRLLFATCVTSKKTSITGDDRLKALADEVLADPDLGWSLYMEWQNNREESILEHFFCRYGINSIEFLRRILVNPGGGRYVYYLWRDAMGKWAWHYARLADLRREGDKVLILR